MVAFISIQLLVAGAQEVVFHHVWGFARQAECRGGGPESPGYKERNDGASWNLSLVKKEENFKDSLVIFSMNTASSTFPSVGQNHSRAFPEA